MSPRRSRHAGVEQLRDVIGREMLSAQLHKTGRAGVSAPGTPALTPDHRLEHSGASVILPRADDTWTTEVRRAAFHAVRVAAARREAGDRVLRYFLRSAEAHGLTLDELAAASRLSRDEVLRLTDPAVCG